jgi:hypothetical protein
VAAVAEHAEAVPEPQPELEGAAGNPPFAIASYDYTADESNELCASSFTFLTLVGVV